LTPSLAGQTDAIAVGQVLLGPAGIRVEVLGVESASAVVGLGVLGLPVGGVLLSALASVLDAPAVHNDKAMCH
jgi:LysM repeat protein